MPSFDIISEVNQVEVHPYYSQPTLRAVHERLGILTQAWSPLGQVYVYRPTDDRKNVLVDPVISDIAARYGKSPGQVILRWHLDSGFDL